MATDNLDPLHYVTDRSHGAVRLNVACSEDSGFRSDGTQMEVIGIMVLSGEFAVGPNDGG